MVKIYSSARMANGNPLVLRSPAGNPSIGWEAQRIQDCLWPLHALTALWWVIPTVLPYCNVLPFRSAINMDRAEFPARCLSCGESFGKLTGLSKCGSRDVTNNQHCAIP